MSETIRSAEPLGPELARKGIHMAMGLLALTLRWLEPWQAALLLLAALLFNAFVLHRVTRGYLLREAERARSFSWGVLLYPAALLATVLIFRHRLELAAAVWALLAFGDGMAAVAGVVLRGPRLPWNRHKTWVGWVAFVIWGASTAACLLRWTQAAVLDAARAVPARQVTWIGSTFLGSGSPTGDWVELVLGCSAAALAAGFAESLDTRIDDNVRVTLAAATVLWLLGTFP